MARIWTTEPSNGNMLRSPAPASKRKRSRHPQEKENLDRTITDLRHSFTMPRLACSPILDLRDQGAHDKNRDIIRNELKCSPQGISLMGAPWSPSPCRQKIEKNDGKSCNNGKLVSSLQGKRPLGSPSYKTLSSWASPSPKGNSNPDSSSCSRRRRTSLRSQSSSACSSVYSSGLSAGVSGLSIPGTPQTPFSLKGDESCCSLFYSPEPSTCSSWTKPDGVDDWGISSPSCESTIRFLNDRLHTLTENNPSLSPLVPKVIPLSLGNDVATIPLLSCLQCH